jgi:hypothetical protein
MMLRLLVTTLSLLVATEAKFNEIKVGIIVREGTKGTKGNGGIVLCQKVAAPSLSPPDRTKN